MGKELPSAKPKLEVENCDIRILPDTAGALYAFSHSLTSDRGRKPIPVISHRKTLSWGGS